MAKTRKRNVKFDREEILLLIRSYMEHPCSWPDIVKTMQDNLIHLSNAAQEMYTSASEQQLKERLSTKLGKMVASKLEDNADEEIR